MRLSLCGFALFGLVVAVGCAEGASDDGDTGKTSGASSFCSGYCTRLHTCDQTKDQKTCENSCENGNAATLPKLRSDIIDLISSCLDKEDCKTVLEGSVISTCSAEATAKVAPSGKASVFCDALGTASKKCGTTSDSATCLTRAKLYNDTALSDATDCTAKACADMNECIDAALGTLKTTGGSPSTTGTDAGTTKKDGGGSISPDGECDGLIDTSTACGACQAEFCCTEISTCLNNTTCSNLAQCVSACSASDSTCVNQCASSYSGGVTMYNEIPSCASSSCETECQ